MIAKEWRIERCVKTKPTEEEEEMTENEERRKNTVAKIRSMLPVSMVCISEQNRGQYSGQRYPETLVVTKFTDKGAFIELETNRGPRRTGFTVGVTQPVCQRDLFLDWAADQVSFMDPAPGVHLVSNMPIVIMPDDPPSGLTSRAARYIDAMAK